jgi:hypothetical protein
MKISLKLVLTISLLWGAPLFAFSNSANVDPNTWLQVGKARLSVLFFDVYDSTLKTPSGQYNGYREPVALEIHYLRDIKASALVQQTVKEWKSLGLSPETYESFLQPLETLWPDVKKGDSLTFVVLPDGSNTFYYNGRELGGLDHPQFGQHFLDIWLSPNTTRPELRAQLLGSNACETLAC